MVWMAPLIVIIRSRSVEGIVDLSSIVCERLDSAHFGNAAFATLV